MESFKNRCNFINNLFKDQYFWVQLCNYFDNDVTKVLHGIGKIVEYYLVCDLSYDGIDDLFSKIDKMDIKESGYVFHPTSQYNRRFLSLYGINGHENNKPISRMLNSLNAKMSFIHYPIGYYDPVYIYRNIDDAINGASKEPRILYEEILKQPRNTEEIVSASQSKTSYYVNIFRRRLEDARDIDETKAFLYEKFISFITGYEPLLVVIPSSKVDYYDGLESYTYSGISAKYLGFINIPSEYNLKRICASNKNAQTYGKLNPRRKAKVKSVVQYSLMEEVTIDDNFTYEDSLLTGDSLYDIDILYGKNNHKNSYLGLSLEEEKNVLRIKYNKDIALDKINGVYRFFNGRHRVIYLQNFYARNKKVYQNRGEFGKLKNMVTILADVTKRFEDPEVNKYLNDFVLRYPKAKVFKNNVENDEYEVVLVVNDQIYYLNGKDDIIAFCSSYPSDSFKCIGVNGEVEEVRNCIPMMIRDVKDKIYSMTLIDYVRYFISKFGFADVKNLFLEYSSIRKDIKMINYHHLDRDIVLEAISSEKMHELGKGIMNILRSNSKLILCEWSDLYEMLRHVDLFKNYDSDYLYKCADLEGYSFLRTQACNDKLKKLKKDK